MATKRRQTLYGDMMAIGNRSLDEYTGIASNFYPKKRVRALAQGARYNSQRERPRQGFTGIAMAIRMGVQVWWQTL